MRLSSNDACPAGTQSNGHFAAGTGAVRRARYATSPTRTCGMQSSSGAAGDMGLLIEIR